jgi:hypothetical protein
MLLKAVQEDSENVSPALAFSERLCVAVCSCKGFWSRAKGARLRAAQEKSERVASASIRLIRGKHKVGRASAPRILIALRAATLSDAAEGGARR